jgi:uncharacterized protein
MRRIRFPDALEGYIQDDGAEGARQPGYPFTLMPKILDRTAHRPWPLPRGPWVMAQVWHDLLFAHWRIDAALLRPLIPAALQIDPFDGSAWIAVVPFRMSGVRLRFTPGLPGLSAFPELNVRTYVTLGGKPGVWFFSLDAANAIAVAVARTWFHLPYFRARMTCEDRAECVFYRSERTHDGARVGVLDAKYRPVAAAFEPRPGTLEHFLTERYCLYAVDSAGRLSRSEIHHPPWQLQVAEAKFAGNSMTQAAGVPLPEGNPLLHFARRQDVAVWRPRRVT